MNNSLQETSPDIQDTEFGSPALSKQRRIIHFSSGETMEEEEEEEEHLVNRPPFKDAAERTRLSFKSAAFLVGRISLLICDFLGERLAGALGLNAAKYQYAIDQHQRDHKTVSSRTTGNLMEGRAEAIHLSPGRNGSLYGATDLQGTCDKTNMDRGEGHHNRAYQVDEDCFK